jgi:hypothetical protein
MKSLDKITNEIEECQKHIDECIARFDHTSTADNTMIIASSQNWHGRKAGLMWVLESDNEDETPTTESSIIRL